MKFEGDNQTTMQSTVELYYDHNLPIEALYLDQKVYSTKKNFELRSDLIPNLTALRHSSAQFRNIKIVGYVDPTIIVPENVSYADTENIYYVDGNAQGIFVKSSISDNGKYGKNLIGQRGNRQCVYLDWFQYSSTQTFWNQAIENYLTSVQFDGLWTQNNEATNDVPGEIKDKK
jgi:alpha-glucosidase (family GH31 glycosyl hydrolase)